MKLPAASSGVSPGDIIFLAASGGEFNPERLNQRQIPLRLADSNISQFPKPHAFLASWQPGFS